MRKGRHLHRQFAVRAATNWDESEKPACRSGTIIQASPEVQRLLKDTGAKIVPIPASAAQRPLRPPMASVNGVSGEKLNNLGVGFTLGYQVNSNLALTFSYKSTVNDSAPGDLRMDGFMLTLVYGWHPIIEGSRRLKSGE